MFPATTYTNAWLTKQAREIGGCKADLLERSVHALPLLLRHLAETGLPFVFKGGASLLLHLNPVIVAHLRVGKDFDFAASRYTGSSEQIAALRAATLNGNPHAWLEGPKAVNPEAYHYWWLAIRQLG